ncbi:unnamed protein product [Linum trigynum]|uniref:Uncharacterized protein n=1 Tax=Linum trigynum TaxID=586398 RepID=A0AAV2FS79_9ROSI
MNKKRRAPWSAIIAGKRGIRISRSATTMNGWRLRSLRRRVGGECWRKVAVARKVEADAEEEDAGDGDTLVTMATFDWKSRPQLT